ncbi:MAG: sodium:solute symporter family protein [Betaproteobacteria bacterium]|nr:sodium:solute symporter family protein [Betaproteobacteria bacterium]
MLIASVLLYLAITIGIGLWAARRVHNAKDYLVAGRSLPLYMNMATVFATWFGAETVLSVSATFAKDGLHGVPADPFGASFALVFVALFFAKAFYRMDLLTIGDFYHKRYGKLVEVLTSLAITASYLGWTSAQLTALGLVFHVLSGGALSLNECIALGAAVVIVYTMFGGMWSVALTDLFQTVIIVIGLLVIAWLIGDLAGGPAKVIAQAHADGKFDFWPSGGVAEWLPFVAAWMTMALGSIPQQDVFQRVTSAKDERTAVRGTLLGGAAYFIFAFVPMFIAYAAIVIDPTFTDLFASEDGREVQRILPDLILNRMPGWAQVVFFGALLSAILSTASGALLAPTALFTENVLRPFMPRVSDRRFLVMLRTVLVLFSCAALLFALNSRSTMYEMVQNAYKVTLVGALVPLAAGIFWKRATVQGALLSIFSGLVVWLACETNFADALVPPQINGLIAALAGMLIGSLAPQLVPDHRGGAASTA